MVTEQTDSKLDLPFVEFLRSLRLEGLDLAREADFGREVDLDCAD